MLKKIILLVLGLNIQLTYAQSVVDQELDFNIVERSIPEALLQLSKISGVDIAFSHQFFEVEQRISLQVEKQLLSSVLKTILFNTGIEYKTLGKRIVLFREKSTVYTFSGYIQDAENGERLISATIYAPGLGKGTTSNEYGFFSLTLPAGKAEIQYRYLGYTPKNEQLSLTENIQKQVNLQPSFTLEEVIVTPDSTKNPSFTTFEQSIPLTGDILHMAPSIGGEADPVRAAQLLPGIQGGIDGMGGTQVRGGDNGHNLMLLDGVPVYIPFHLFGMFSIYNARTVRSAKVLKGSFPAHYGGRLSSVFDIRMREGNRQFWETEASASLISTNLMLEGPIRKDQTSLLLAGRFMHSDFLLNPIIGQTFFNEEQDELNFRFNDVNAKLNHRLSDRNHLYLSFYYGNDFLEGSRLSDFFVEEEEDFGTNEFEFDLDWSNTVFALRWNHLFNHKLFSNTTLTYSQYNFSYGVLDEYEIPILEDEVEEDLFFFGNLSKNRDYTLKTDFDFLPNPNHQWKFGAGVSLRYFQPDIFFFDEDASILGILDDPSVENILNQFEPETFKATESYFYVEDNMVISPSFSGQFGMRFSSFIHDGAIFSRIEPRFNLQLEVNQNIKWQLSGSRMIQYLHLISTATVRLPNDLWLPSSETVLPQEAWQGELGLHFSLQNQFHFSMEAYYKKMSNLYAYKEEFFLDDNPEEEVEGDLSKGNGETYGIDVLLKKEGAKTGGLVGYTLAWANRTFADHNLGLPYPSAFDQRHQLKVFLFHAFTPRLRVSLHWIYNSPTPRLDVPNLINILNGEAIIPPNSEGNRNLIRLPSYHRLDFNLLYEVQKSIARHQIKLGVYNLYDQYNIAFYNLAINEETGLLFERPVAAIPFLPSLAYSIKF